MDRTCEIKGSCASIAHLLRARHRHHTGTHLRGRSAAPQDAAPVWREVREELLRGLGGDELADDRDPIAEGHRVPDLLEAFAVLGRERAEARPAAAVLAGTDPLVPVEVEDDRISTDAGDDEVQSRGALLVVVACDGGRGEIDEGAHGDAGVVDLVSAVDPAVDAQHRDRACLGGGCGLGRGGGADVGGGVGHGVLLHVADVVGLGREGGAVGVVVHVRAPVVVVPARAGRFLPAGLPSMVR